jgi:threonine/homoserine/homoserine lactone efflux protein
MGMTYAFAAAVQPGPFQTYLISQTLSNGWKNAIPAAFAPLLSDGPIILLVLLLLSRMPVWLVQSLQCAGGIFLLYLAIGAFRNWRDFYVKNSAHTWTGQQTVIKAALVNFLNPNPWLAWSLVMGPLLLKGWQEAPANGLSLLVGFYATIIIVTLGIMLIFAGARNLGPRVSRTIVGISAIAMACFGFYELWLVLKMVLPN